MNKMKLIAGAALLAVLCACVTPYDRASRPDGDGYYDTQLQTGVYEVTFHGSDVTPNIKVRDYALLRAAEVCIENGYNSFAVLNDGDISKTTEDLVMQKEVFMKVSEVRPAVALIIHCSKGDELFYNPKEISESIRKKYGLKPSGNEYSRVRNLQMEEGDFSFVKEFKEDFE